MSNAAQPEVKVPQKVYRFLLKGLHFIGTQRKNCTFDDLVSYVYLKNNRQYRIDLVEKFVREASNQFVTQGLLKRSGRNSFRFHEQFLHETERPTALVGLDDPDRDERLTVDPSRRKPVPVSGSESELPPAKRFRDRKGTKATLPKYREHSGSNPYDGLDFGLVPVLEPLEFGSEDEPRTSRIQIVEVPEAKQEDTNMIPKLLSFSDSDSD